jgi:hypothetical protein
MCRPVVSCVVAVELAVVAYFVVESGAVPPICPSLSSQVSVPRPRRRDVVMTVEMFLTSLTLVNQILPTLQMIFDTLT